MSSSVFDELHATQKELKDLRTDSDGEIERIHRVHFYRGTPKTGFCPFCESDEGVEWVSETGIGGEWKKQRYECECGAYGDRVWTWEAGTLEVSW